MCGIVAGFSFTERPINKIVRKQFYRQKSRGTQGFGIYDHDYKNLIRSTGQGNIIKWLNKHPSKSIIFHHRFPTSTDNVKNACHPFSTKEFFKTNYILVHNGHISNSRELKIAHEKLGIEYYSVQKDGRFNDSEALLWDVALYLEGKQEKLEATGGIAFVCMATSKGNKHDKVYFARNTNPLKILYNTYQLVVSSEGKGEVVEDNKLHCYNMVKKELRTEDLEIPKYKAYVHNGYTYKGAGAKSNYNNSHHSGSGNWPEDYDRNGDPIPYSDFSALHDDDDDELNELASRYAGDKDRGNNSFGYIDEYDKWFAQQLVVESKRMETAVQIDIQKNYRNYMIYANGLFSRAMNDLTDDFDMLDEYRMTLVKEHNPTHYEDVEYTLRMLTEIGQKIDDNPSNLGDNSREMKYMRRDDDYRDDGEARTGRTSAKDDKNTLKIPAEEVKTTKIIVEQPQLLLPPALEQISEKGGK